MNCIFSPHFCVAAEHDDAEQCIREMKYYFGIAEGYLCPTCSSLTENWREFYNVHGSHLKNYSKMMLAREVLQNEEYMPQYGGQKRKAETITVQAKKPRIEGNLNDAHVNLESDISDVETNRVFVPQSLKREVASTLRKMGQAKIQFDIFVKFIRDDGETKSWWLSNVAVVFSPTFYEDGIEKLKEKIDTYTKLGSGWHVDQVLKVTMTMTKVSDLIYVTGSSYIESPESINQSKAVVNVQNKDHFCFLYSILAAVNYDKIPKNRYRVTNYNLSDLVYKEKWFPMRVSDIYKFEKSNPQYAINVLTYTESKNKIPKADVFKNENFNLIRKSKSDGQKIFLLLLENETNFHYTAVII